MLTDRENNLVYVSERLEPAHSVLVDGLRGTLAEHGIAMKEIRGTRDVWCRDYMPVQVGCDEFMRFLYAPDYLRRYEHLITRPGDVGPIPEIGRCLESDLVLDGGNVVRWGRRCIVTDKVIRENSGLDRDDVHGRLREALRIEDLIVIPQEPYDVVGHAERVSRFPEFKPYYQSAAKADDEYMPGGPPMSPLTGSYFTTWAFFDLRFGPDYETIGTCLLDVAQPLGLGPEVTEAVRLMSETRMGVYEHAGVRGGRCLLRELITDDKFECYVPAGYPGKAGELWFARLCPPVGPADYHVAFTTPYILTGFGKADWTAYLSKSLIGLTALEKRRRLHEFLKYGREPGFWNEFVFQAYHHHRADAIFLTGLPDVPGSLPHA